MRVQAGSFRGKKENYLQVAVGSKGDFRCDDMRTAGTKGTATT